MCRFYQMRKFSCLFFVNNTFVSYISSQGHTLVDVIINLSVSFLFFFFSFIYFIHKHVRNRIYIHTIEQRTSVHTTSIDFGWSLGKYST